ncbi:MAG: MMPL family transporter [Deltaproteobacteria bacterium]|nr:MMPL family transporter [Deltaproteobacteria bacterium]
MPLSYVVDTLEHLIFTRRRWVMGIFAALTVIIAYYATQLRVDAGFNKLLPLKHEYMQTFTAYQEEFGGANQVLIALAAKDGDIFTVDFFETLKKVTDEVFFLPGVDRTQVRSLFTPNVRFTEVVEDGIAGGNVVPDDFDFTPAGLEQVRRNILKSNIVGRLVANDFSAAIVSTQLMEFDPTTGERLNYIDVARQIEEKIRARYSNEFIDIHIIGFAKVIGDITAGAVRVLFFFLATIAITTLLVYLYTQSWRLTIVPIACSLIAVIWQLGLLSLLGFGIDPMSILVPFLVFAIGVSHGVQMLNAVRSEVFFSENIQEAARASFRRLLVPGSIALASDTIGFITILLIDIKIIQEMAITASLGVGVIIFTNLVLVPVLLSYVRYDEAYRRKIGRWAVHLERFWLTLARVCDKRPAGIIILASIGLMAFGVWKATNVKIGDLHRGVPELRADSRYNIDSEVISNRFSIGVDILSVIVETIPEGCINYDVMTTIDRFVWQMRNVQGVQSVMSLSEVAKVINSGWNEGSLKWRVLPRNQSALSQSVSYVPTSSGLLNTDCSAMPVLIFTSDHKAETIAHVISEIKKFREANESNDIRFRLASGNVGVMAATNEEVKAAQFPILVYVFSAIIVLCLVTFWSARGTLCIVLPLGLVSLLAYAVMSMLEIGLKVSTLPVVALGVGIGVDYGIYVYSRFKSFRTEGISLEEAYLDTLRVAGSAVIFTGVTLALGVATWIFSPLKFQADMGILLTFMFIVNMLGAILLLPALARWFFRSYR